MAQEIGDRRNEAGALLGFGMAYTRMGRPKAALSAFRQQLTILEELDNRPGQAGTLALMGVIYIKQWRFLKGVGCFRSVVRISSELEDRYLPLMEKRGTRVGKLNGADLLFQLGKNIRSRDIARSAPPTS